MSNFTDFIGGGGGGSFPTFFLHKSATWIPPQDGNIMIHVIGAGGSGAGSTSSGIQSGAAGGYCRKNSLAVTTSGSFTVTIGAGGVSQIGSSGAGTAGGTTSVAGTGLGSTLTATGGAGGAISTGTYTTGGVGSNGDFNSNGGRGGYRRGGGAVGLSGTGLDGGTFNSSSSTSGANCDVLGDFYSSSFGQLSGGGGGVFYITSSIIQQITAGELAGAGNCTTASGPLASHASVGGGGGATANNESAKIVSGRGGEGCVVIQYIP